MKTLILALLLCAGPAWAQQESILIDTVAPCYEQINGKWINVECPESAELHADDMFHDLNIAAPMSCIMVDRAMLEEMIATAKKLGGTLSVALHSYDAKTKEWKQVSIDEFSCLFRMKQAMKDADAILSQVVEYEPSYDGCNTCDSRGCMALHCAWNTTVARLEWELERVKKRDAAEVRKQEAVKQWRDVMKECVQ